MTLIFSLFPILLLVFFMIFFVQSFPRITMEPKLHHAHDDSRYENRDNRYRWPVLYEGIEQIGDDDDPEKGF